MGHRHSRHIDRFLAQPPHVILALLDLPVDTVVPEAKVRAVQARDEASRAAVAAGLPVSPPEEFRVRRRVRVNEYQALALYDQVWADYHEVKAAWEAALPRQVRRLEHDAAVKSRHAKSAQLRDALNQKFPDLQGELLDALVQSAVERESTNRVEVLRRYVGTKLGVKKRRTERRESTVRDAVAAARQRRVQWDQFLKWVAREQPDRRAELTVLADGLEQWRGQWVGSCPDDFYVLCGPVLLDRIRHAALARSLRYATPPSRVSPDWVAEQLQQLRSTNPGLC